MKRGIAFLLVIVSIFALCACDNGSKSENNLTVADVCGIWYEDLGDGTETLTLNEDMTYNKHIIVHNPTVELTSHDTYKLKGNKIIINYSDYGTESEYTVTIEGDTMIWDNGTSQILYTRKN